MYRLAEVSRPDHRPVRGAGRAVRARVRRPARQPLVRRRAGVAHVLRARADRPAAAARRVPGARAADRSRARRDVRAPRDARAGRDRRTRARRRGARHGDGRDRVARRRRGGAGDRRLRQRLLPLHVRQGLQRHGDLARLQAGRRLRQPVLHADPSHLHSRERRVPVEAHADERVAAQRRAHLGAEGAGRRARARQTSRRRSATTTSSACIRASATSRRATSRRARRSECATRAAASARAATASTSTSPMRSPGSGAPGIEERYGNLFEMYERITGEDPYRVPMRIYPATHYTMGGLWVDYDLMSTIPGLFVHRRGELLRPRRQPARRERADAGARRRLLHPAVHDRRLPGRGAARRRRRRPRRSSATAEAAVARRVRRLLGVGGRRTVMSFHRELGQDHVGRLRHVAQRARASRRRCAQHSRAARGVLAGRHACPAPAPS